MMGKLFILLCLYERERRQLHKSLAVGGQETQGTYFSPLLQWHSDTEVVGGTAL